MSLEKAALTEGIMLRFAAYSQMVLLNIYLEDLPEAKRIKKSMAIEFERHIFGNKIAFDASREENSTLDMTYKMLFGFTQKEHSKIFDEAMDEAMVLIRKLLQI